MRYLGANVSAAGGHQNIVSAAVKFQMNSVQTMPTAPMRWATKDVPMEQVEAFVKAQKDSVLKKYLIHGIYLTNLARQDKQLFHLGKLSVATYLKYLEDVRKMADDNGNDLDILGVTFHPGSAKDLTQEEGVKRISEGLNWINDQIPGEQMMLLESSAGAGAIMGDTLEELAAMRDGVENKGRVGYVLDTQHMFVSGYDWQNDLDGVVEKIDSVLGLELVKCFHLNDSLYELNAHKDRHANIGQGKIGEEALKAVINHPKLKGIPFILETPALKSDETMGEEVKRLMSWAEE
jgi:deoxyribonuclease-4